MEDHDQLDESEERFRRLGARSDQLKDLSGSDCFDDNPHIHLYGMSQLKAPFARLDTRLKLEAPEDSRSDIGSISVVTDLGFTLKRFLKGDDPAAVLSDPLSQRARAAQAHLFRMLISANTSSQRWHSMAFLLTRETR